MPTSKKTVSQDTSCVNLQDLEESYEKDLLKDLLTEAGGSTPQKKEDSRQEAIPEGKGTKTKKIPFLSKRHTPQLEVEDLDFDKLGKEADLKFDKQQKDRISDVINICRRDSASWVQGAEAGKARDHMNRVAKTASKLSNLLSCATTKEHAIVDHYWALALSPSQLRMILAELAASTKAAADNISTGPGNPGNPHIYTLVSRLHYIWTQAGGEGRCSYPVPEDGYSGSFFFFMQEIIKQADLPHREPKGLHNIILAAVPSS